MTNQELIDKAVQIAKQTQIRDDLCSRSAIYGLQSVFDFIPDSLVKACASLAGGCGSASGSCGAYASCLLAVGLKFNSTMDEEEENPEAFPMKTAAAFNKYRDLFRAEMGTTLCPEIQEKLFGRSYKLYEPEEVQEYLSLPGHAEKCAEVVGTAVNLAAKMLLEEGSALT